MLGADPVVWNSIRWEVVSQSVSPRYKHTKPAAFVLLVALSWRYANAEAKGGGLALVSNSVILLFTPIINPSR